MPDMLIRPSLKFIKLGYAAVALLVAAAAAANLIWLDGAYPWLPAAAAVLLLWPAQRHVRRQFTRAALTGDKLRYESGFLSRTTRNLQLSKVQDVRVDQSLGQRLWGMGDLAIETAGETSRLTILNVDRPQEIADHIIEAAQRGGQAHTA